MKQPLSYANDTTLELRQWKNAWATPLVTAMKQTLSYA